MIDLIKEYENAVLDIDSLIDLISFCREQGLHKFAWLLLQNAQTFLNVNKTQTKEEKRQLRQRIVWETSIIAFYVDNHPQGFRACENIIHNHRASNKQCGLNNLVHYIDPLHTLVHNISSQRLLSTITIGDKLDVENKPMILCNPSIAIDDKKKIIYNFRAHNYVFDILTNSYHYEDPCIETTNLLSYLERNEWEQEAVHPISVIDKPMVFPSNVLGYEDVRLIYFRGNLYGIATSREHTRSNINKMYLLKYDGDNKDKVTVKALVHENSALNLFDEDRCEKNWSPFVCNDELLMIYTFSPLIILHCDVDTGMLRFKQHSITKRDMTSYRGGTQFVPFHLFEQNGYLGIIHQVAQRPLPNNIWGRYYFHRFVFIFNHNDNHKQKKGFRVRAVSKPFYFREKTVEFASGLVVTDTEIIITYGFEDKQPWQCNIPLESFRKSIKSLFPRTIY